MISLLALLPFTALVAVALQHTIFARFAIPVVVWPVRSIVFLRIFPYSDIPLPKVQQLFHSEILVVAEYFRAQMRSLRFEVI